jgi:hypothetical protein
MMNGQEWLAYAVLSVKVDPKVDLLSTQQKENPQKRLR